VQAFHIFNNAQRVSSRKHLLSSSIYYNLTISVFIGPFHRRSRNRDLASDPSPDRSKSLFGLVCVFLGEDFDIFLCLEYGAICIDRIGMEDTHSILGWKDDDTALM